MSVLAACELAIYERDGPRARRVFQSHVRQTLMKLRASSHARFTGDYDTAGGCGLSCSAQEADMYRAAFPAECLCSETAHRREPVGWGKLANLIIFVIF